MAASDTDPGSAVVCRVTRDGVASLYGSINVQQAAPGQTIAWGVQPEVSYDTISVDVLINGARYDHKDQTYDPHGSISPAYLTPGAHIEITGSASDSKGTAIFHLKCSNI